VRRGLPLVADRETFLRSYGRFYHELSLPASFTPILSAKTPFFPAALPHNGENPPLFPSATLSSEQTSPATVFGRHCRSCLYHPFCPVLRRLDGRHGGLGRVFTRGTHF
jgi:hypothetical protein